MKRLIIALVAAAIGLAAGWSLRGEAPEPIEKASAQQLWTCGMHPQVIRSEPGFCPICGMELTPLESKEKKDGARAREITIDPAVVQNMGVRTAAVGEGPVKRTIRTVAVLAEAQPNQHDVNLRVDGWIEKLYADTEGMHLAKGDPLFDLYSPQLQVGIEELIAARRAGQATASERREERGGGERGGAGGTLYAAAERKLALLGLSAEQIEALAGLERAPRTVTFRSPIHGHLIEKLVVQGAAVKEGDRVLRIVDHSRLWIDAQVHEQNLPFVQMGLPLVTTVDGVPGKTFDGRVMFIHPHVEAMTRTAMVRAWIDNPSLELRPGMYATAEITAEINPRAVLAPREAVIDTGTRQVAFLARPGGHFEPREVRMGSPSEDGMVEILSGLSPGEVVVTSGQFLFDAESRFREAVAKFQSQSAATDATPAALPRGGHDHANH